MYDTQKIAQRIKIITKENGGTVGNMLSELNLGVNIISQLAKGQEMSCINLAKIADYLNVSVDYLLGRTGTPDIDPTDRMQAEFFETFKNLSVADKIAVMNFAFEQVRKE
ncbi:MAG: hypothetical protein NC244_05500 [Alistipes senegalensis]|nr:hypothetical protein [Alistipes senegalensis]